MTRTILATMLFFVLITMGCTFGPRPANNSSSRMMQEAMLKAELEEKAVPEPPEEEAVANPVTLTVKHPNDLWVLKTGKWQDAPSDGLLIELEHRGVRAQVSVLALPSERIRSPKAEAHAICAAYALSGMEVSPLQSDLQGTYGRCAYAGTRDGIPVKGALMVYRLKDNPAYTVKLQGEWLSIAHNDMLDDFDEFVSGISVE